MDQSERLAPEAYRRPAEMIHKEQDQRVLDASVILEALKLYRNSNTTLSQLIDYSNSQQLTTPASFYEFYSEICKVCSSQTSDTFSKIILNDYSQYWLSEGTFRYQLIFPLPNKTNISLYHQVLRWFANQYIEQYQDRKQEGDKKNQSDQSPNDEDIFYQFFQKINFKFLKSQRDPQQKKNSNNSQLIKASLKFMNFYNKDIPVIPLFLSEIKNKQRLSFKRLYSLDLTQIFRVELDKVKEQIGKQLVKDSYLMKKYQEFIRRYLQFYIIKEGTLEKELYTQKLENQVDFYEFKYMNNYNFVHFRSDLKSQMLQFWENLLPKIEEMMTNDYREDYSQLIRKICLDKLKNVVLYYTPLHFNEKVFAQTSINGIFINLNHMKNTMTLEQLRNGPLKPYLLVCLYHELAHEIIRYVHKQKIGIEIKQIDRSFDLNEKSMGSKIIRIVKKNANQFQEFQKRLMIKSCNQFPDKRQNTEKINRYIKETQDTLAQFQKVIIILRNNFDQLKTLQKKLKAFVEVQAKLYKIDFSTQDKQAWLGLCNDIIENYDRHEASNAVIVEKHEQYLFFKALLLCQENMEIFRNKQLYFDAKKKLMSSKNICYFNIKNPFIDSILVKIKLNIKDFFSDPIVKHFITTFSSKNALQNLEKSAKQLVRSYYSDISSFNQIFIQYSSKLMEEEAYLQSRIIKTIFNEKIVMSQLYNLIKAKNRYRIAMRDIKLSEIYLIASQFPDIIFHQQKGRLDSGSYFEDNLFPNLKENKKIFAKDYDLLINLTAQSSRLVGQIPKDSAERQNYLEAHKEKESASELGMDLKECECGIERYGYDWHRFQDKPKELRRQLFATEEAFIRFNQWKKQMINREK